ncbi:sigma 54-interacting transcriptional regulator [Mucilaginibacter celer]|uniref:AAA family ATPase n=1 Tax=Mucilaginibacter celer TaxID=2305508 RepID=A0A494VNG1_9SPHI|nr:sigma 54-interacting transcriptional regulator [Mucilaginibacter celer]AYL96936.1 AAA family ATPase [Mucilaginibacter celer]
MTEGLPGKFNTQDQIITQLGWEIASIKNRDQLNNLLGSSLKRIVEYQYTTIFMHGDDGKELINFLQQSGDKENPNQFSERIFNGKIPFGHDINPPQVQPPQPIIDFDELVLNGNAGPYLINGEIDETFDFYTFNLRQGTAIIGVWVMLLKKADGKHFDMGALCNQIASYLTFAVLNIKAQEEIDNRDKEREIILSLNIDFATIREKKDLLRIIHYKLRSLFNFSHHWVATVNDDELTLSTFMQDTESKTKFHPKYKQVTYAKYTIADQIFNKVILASEPQVFDLEQLSARGTIPEYLQINYECGIRKVIMQSLEIAGRFIGVWALCLGEQDEVDHRYINIVRDIANQFSIAVGNIIANETIQARQSEQGLLLNLSYDITSIKDKKDLLQIIQVNLKRLFKFQNIVIMVLNNDDQTHDIFLSTDLAFTKENLARYSNGPVRFEYNDGYFNRVMEADGIVHFNLDKIADLTQEPACLQYLHQSGIRKRIGIALREDNRNIGVLYINLENNFDYSDRVLDLVKGVSYQISAAVSNILANEEILKKDKERDLLLSLSVDIASVRSNSELLNVISQRLKYLLKFSHTGVVTINDDATVSRFLRDPEAKSITHPQYMQADQMKYPIQDNILDKCIITPEPLLFNLRELTETANGELPLYLKINYESGLKNMVVIRFSKDDRAFGFWILLYDQDIVWDIGLQNLIKGLSHQISIAVSNIIANNEISRREEEKSRLLAFSNAIASVKTTREVSTIINTQFMDWGIKGYSMHIINDDKTTHRPYLYDSSAEWTNFPNYNALVTGIYAVNDNVMDVMIRAGKPMMHNIPKLAEMKNAPKYTQFWKEIGLIDIMSIPVRLGDELIGVLFLDFSDSFKALPDQLSLLNSICSQLAITVANLSANEKISKQLGEINKYKQQLEEEKIYLKEEIETTQNYGDIIGESPVIKKIFKLVSQVASSDSTALILGETGTGKELIARAIHNNSPRKNKLMVKVNCAALPPNLIESELFGHERGSFTGATEQRLGKFELANNSTLFLDEIGEMPLDLQVKLLRALQEKEIERVGGRKTIRVDVRIVAATNRDLEKEVAEGRFRSDLYYRLNIFPIYLPALRDRREDIPLLASYFIRRFAKKAGRQITTLSSRALQDLISYHWPGNIRELEHLIERSVLISSGDTIKQVHLPSTKHTATVANPDEVSLKTIDENERDHILRILKYCGGKLAGDSGAARILGVPAGTLYSKMKRLQIKREHF